MYTASILHSDEYMCLLVCLFVYLSNRITRKSRGRTPPVLCRLTVAIARSSSERCSTLSTSGFVDDVTFSYHGANGQESSTTLYFEEVRQVAVPVGHQTTAVLDRVHYNAAPGAQSAVYVFLVHRALKSPAIVPTVA